MVSSLSGGLVLACPTDLQIAVAVARAAEGAGAAALRAPSPEAVATVKGAARLPVIGSWVRPDGRGQPVMTPDLAAASALVEAGADMIALDATAEAHPVPGLLAQLIRQIKQELERPVVARVVTVVEAERAAGYGADWIACSDLALVREVATTAGLPTLYDGPCLSPALARAAARAGAALVVAHVSVEEQAARLAAALKPAGGKPTAEGYWAAAGAAIAWVQATQGPAIREAAALFAQSILAGGVVHIFGAGHSRAFGMELSGRAGGLVPMHLFGLEEVAPPGKKGLQLLDLERGPETAHALLGLFSAHQADLFVIASNSGRNGCPVELALEVKRRGHSLVTVTSLEHASRVPARHSSDQRVFEVADVVIDNGAPYGDAVLTAPGLKEAVCAVSSATGALIAQALTAETIRLILEAGAEPPVYISANVDGADEHNARLEARYAGRI
jgi:uncharacterized phosphosugar-binding protein/putative N-acetylmannosamine-6-phosphate epimerase